jgi:hypothetical protein
LRFGRVGLDRKRRVPCGVLVLPPQRRTVLRQREILWNQIGPLPDREMDDMAAPNCGQVTRVRILGKAREPGFQIRMKLGLGVIRVAQSTETNLLRTQSVT